MVVGGDPTFGVQSISKFFFQDNGWKMRPKEINHTANMTDGIIIPESGSPYIDTIGTYRVSIRDVQPEHALTVALAGALTPTDIADIVDGVWTDEVGYAGNQKGSVLVDIKNGQKLPNLLIKDKLS